MSLCDYGCGQEGIYKIGNRLCCSKSYNSCPAKKVRKIVPREKPEVCDYGCGQEPKFRFANDKWCCSASQNACPSKAKRCAEASFGKRGDGHAKPFGTIELCSFGCGKIAEFKYKSGQYCCLDDWHRCPGQHENISKRTTIIWSDKQRRKNLSDLRKKNKKVPKPIALSEDTEYKCKYCGEKAKFLFKTHMLYSCSDRIERCPVVREDASKKNKIRWEAPEFREMMSGRECSEETRNKISKSQIGKTISEETKRKIALTRKGKSLEEWLGSKEKADAYRLKKSLLMKGKTFKDRFGEERAKEIIKKTSDKLKGRTHTLETRKKMSIKKKEHWKDPNVTYNQKEWREMKGRNTSQRLLDPEYCKMMQQALHMKPNKPETLLINLFKDLNLDFKYVGDFSVIINGKNPDFIDEEKSLIIEFFGDYWHGEKYRNDGISNETHEQQRIEHFQQQGYECLIIWETDLQENLQETVNKILEFSCNTQL